jgi:hypothetical protein
MQRKVDRIQGGQILRFYGMPPLCTDCLLRIWTNSETVMNQYPLSCKFGKIFSSARIV